MSRMKDWLMDVFEYYMACNSLEITANAFGISTKDVEEIVIMFE